MTGPFPPIRKAKFRARSDPATEVDLLQQSLDEMDRTQPGWDNAARAAACKAALEDGVDEKALEQVYGQAMVEDAKLASTSNVVDDVVFVEPVGTSATRHYFSERMPGRVVGYGHISDPNQNLLKIMHVGTEVEIVRTAGVV